MKRHTFFDTVCGNCGRSRGSHHSRTAACPIGKPGRAGIISFSALQVFTAPETKDVVVNELQPGVNLTATVKKLRSEGWTVTKHPNTPLMFHTTLKCRKVAPTGGPEKKGRPPVVRELPRQTRVE
jgi:hypothetical protein